MTFSAEALVAAQWLAGFIVVFVTLAFMAWRRYLWVAGKESEDRLDTCPYSLTEEFDEGHLINAPHQKGAEWLSEIFSRSAEKYPDFTALQIPSTGESLTYAELDSRAADIAAALAPYLSGPDQIVAVAMAQDNWQIVAAHLGILKAGGTLMFLDTTLPDPLISHMLNDAKPVVVLTRDMASFRDYPTVDVLTVPKNDRPLIRPVWLDDPTQRLATVFYTSGTTGMPKGVECPHAGYVNLAFSYADYFDLLPGMDATTLTSSLGYDGSISEMYSAWTVGCSVVLLTKEEVRSGPELVPILRDAEVTMLFCPPVLLTTLTPNPEQDLPYPICRYIVPAGEAFPNALVEPWTRGRRQIINTYGPTEASTDTSRQSLRPGDSVTIGSPLANVTYVILELDQLEPLPHGEEGELCIGGVHVARGYRNLPEQTAAKFIDHPEFGRLYRTGDRCKIDPKTNRVHFLGRADTQLKVRGHRVEAQAVEDILQTQFSEIESAVLDYQNEALIAFVSAPSVAEAEGLGTVAAPADWSASILESLAGQLPEPSVPSQIFLVENFTMKAVSGKIDRDALPDLSRLEINASRKNSSIAKRSGEDTASATAETIDPEQLPILEICRAVFDVPLGWDDKFSDAGGHSIAIARLSQKLQAAGWTVSVRALMSDRNSARKIATLPKQQPTMVASSSTVEAAALTTPRDENAASVMSPEKFTLLQLLFVTLIYSPGLAAFIGLFSVVEFRQFFTTPDIWAFIAVGSFLYFFGLILPFLALPWVMLVKLVMGGSIYKNNVTAGIYPKWSRMHLRTWCIRRLEKLALPLGATYRSAPLYAFVLRQLGATVGRNLQCAQDAGLSGPLDMLTIGDDVGIQTGAYIQITRWVGEELHIGPIRLGSRCKIGMRAAIANDVTIGEETWVAPFSPILKSIGANEMWEGSPARCTGKYTELKRTARTSEYRAPLVVLESVNILFQIFMDFCLNVIPAAAIFWFVSGFIPTGETDLFSNYFRDTTMSQVIFHLTLYAFVSGWISIVTSSIMSCLFIRFTAFSPGIYPSSGIKAAILIYRMKKMNQIQGQWTWTITGQYLRALAGVKFARVGATECDVMFNLIPELTHTHSQIFWSNGSFTNMMEYGAEHIKLRSVNMPEDFFSGNNCVLEYGRYPANFLLGVSTLANDIMFRRQMQSRLDEPITVVGNPPVEFASPPQDCNLANQRLPTFGLFLARVFLNDFFSIGVLRITEMLLFTIFYVWFLRLGGNFLLCSIGALFAAEMSLILLTVSVKKLIVGSDWGRDHQTPFWSWKHFAYFFAQDCFFVWCKGSLAFSAGTILSNPILRMMGCKVGNRTIVAEPLQCSDWNAVSFGDDCVVEGFLQFHTFENMVLRVKRTHIEDRCSVAFGATVMGGARVESGSTLLPLSLVLKEMHMVPGIYEGSPADPVVHFAPTGQAAPAALGQSAIQPIPDLGSVGLSDAELKQQQDPSHD